jgi:predicted TIM-barrel fold metal-dependent hydrolase
VSGNGAAPYNSATDPLPKVISVDDHVTEPAHVWQTYLPQRYRERGPKIYRGKWGPISFSRGGGGRGDYNQQEDPDGVWGDAWIYEDVVIYVHKRFVAIPLDATPGGDLSKFDRTKMQMSPVTYDEMRPGCYDPQARTEEFLTNWVDGSLPFPTFPRFCGQTFLEAPDKDLAAACVYAYNDWMVEEWCAPGMVSIPLCLVPLWDVSLAVAEVQRNAARGVHAVAFSEMPPALNLPSIHSGYWDPLFDVCQDTDTTMCMHIGSSSRLPKASPDAPAGAGNMLAFNTSMASMADFIFGGILHRFPRLRIAYSEGQIGWIPYALERADVTWEQHNTWTHAKDYIPNPPSSYYWGRVFGCFTNDQHGLDSIDKIGHDNVCFETDYPHTDTTWPDTRAHIEKMVVGLPDELVYKVLRGNAISMLSLDRV